MAISDMKNNDHVHINVKRHSLGIKKILPDENMGPKTGRMKTKNSENLGDFIHYISL